MSLRAAPYSSITAVALSFVLYLVKTILHSETEKIPPIYLIIDEKEDIKLQIIEAYR